MFLNNKKNLLLIMIIQIIWLVLLFILYNYFNLLLIIYFIFTIMLLIKMMKNSTNISLELPLILLIIILPFLGNIFILISRMKNKKLQRINRTDNFKSNINLVKFENLNNSNIQYLTNYYPLSKNNVIKYYHTGEDIYKSIIIELDKAQKFIFLEFLIIKPGKMLNSILDILKRKARQGVDVRVIYDYASSHKYFSKHYLDLLLREGIKCLEFNKLPIFSILNYRDHRKIIVIDGIIAYTGGINIADEYINIIHPYGYWKDNGIKIKGDAVWTFTTMFLDIWNAFKSGDKNYLNNKKAITKSDTNSYIIPYGSNPLNDDLISKNLYLNMINQSRNYLYICTPYFIVDDIILNALILATKRGVDVKIIVPGIPDKKSIYCITKSYFKTLIKNNIQVYTYNKGFLHSKILLCDDMYATVGSVNLDYRSLYFNFECGVYIERNEQINDIISDVLNIIRESHLIKRDELNNHLLNNIGVSILKLFAPFM